MSTNTIKEQYNAFMTAREKDIKKVDYEIKLNQDLAVTMEKVSNKRNSRIYE